MNRWWLGVVVALVAGGCGGGAGSKPMIDPADFVDAIDNPYLPFTPGTRWVYEGDVDGAHERIEVTVTSDRKEVLGVSAVVVSDVNYVDGARPGIFMLAEPRVGETYHQHDEDAAEVVRVGVDHSVGLGDYRDVVVVRETSPQEPDVAEEKYYAPGVGKIYEIQTAGGEGGTELVEHTPGS